MVEETAEGRVLIKLVWDGQRIVAARTASSRPSLDGLLTRRTVTEAQAVVSRLYRVCSRAQQSTVAVACAAAAGEPDTYTGCSGIVGERVVEHLWRFVVDLPRLLGQEPRPDVLGAATRALRTAESTGDWRAFGAALAPLVAETVLDCQPSECPADGPEWDQWIEDTGSPVGRWLRKVETEGLGAWGRAAVAVMPVERSGDILAPLAAAMASVQDFVRRPHYSGEPRETGAVAHRGRHPLVSDLLRRQGATVATRLAARLVDLAESVAAFSRHGEQEDKSVGALALGRGTALGWAETARGLLLHRAELNDGIVHGYRILAPTEWNFHPDGPLVSGLLGQEADNEYTLRLGVALTVMSLDPCVSYDLEIRRA